jgi:hypothetical protein
MTKKKRESQFDVYGSYENQVRSKGGNQFDVYSSYENQPQQMDMIQKLRSKHIKVIGCVEIRQTRSGSMFRDARDTLKGLEIAERQFQREQFKLCDWNDPEDVAYYRKQKSVEKRNKFLNRKYPDRRCPSCGRITLSVSQWVINKRERTAICKSCFKRLKYNHPRKDALFIDEKIFKPERYSIDAYEFTKLRMEKNIGMGEFGKIAGWGKSYQQKLENGWVKTVANDCMNSIISILGECEYIFKPERFLFDQRLLIELRIASGLSMSEFGRIAGWGLSYQQKLEDGGIKTVSPEAMNVIIIILNDYYITTRDELVFDNTDVEYSTTTEEPE